MIKRQRSKTEKITLLLCIFFFTHNSIQVMWEIEALKFRAKAGGMLERFQTMRTQQQG